MKGFSPNKLRYFVNDSFFNFWTPQMAYVLGFTFADGNIHRTSLSWDVQLQDRNILEKIQFAMKSDYPICLQRKRSYRFRINNQKLISGAVEKGLLPKKNMRDILPEIPEVFLRHFIRGYIDGDGWLVVRNGRNEFDIGYTSGNREFLESLTTIISMSLDIKRVNVRLRKKITAKGITSITYMVEFYSSSAYKIAKWLYGDLDQTDLVLDRKYLTYKRAESLYEYLQSGTDGIRKVQDKFGRKIKDLLIDLYINQKLGGEKVAKILGVHSSSVYRWLERTGLKYPEHRKIYG